MSSLLVELLPSAAGLAITPTAIAVGILFLGSRRPVANDLAFAAPFALVYSALAAVILVAASASDDPLISNHTKHVVALAAGLLLLAAALASGLRSRRGQGHPVHQSRLIAEVDSARPPAAFVIGLVLAVLNPNVAILIAGLAIIAAADVSTGGQIGAAVFLVLASEVGLLGPLAWFLAHRESATRGLSRLKAWLGRHEHQVDLAVLVVFGVIFTVKGAAGLA